MDLLRAIVCFKATQHIKSTVGADGALLGATVKAQMNKHPETANIKKSLLNKKSYLVKKGFDLPGAYNQDNDVYYPLEIWETLGSGDNNARGRLMVMVIIPFLKEYYNETWGGEISINSITGPLRRISLPKLQQLSDALAAHDVAHELAAQILRLSRPAIEDLVCWLGEPKISDSKPKPAEKPKPMVEPMELSDEKPVSDPVPPPDVVAEKETEAPAPPEPAVATADPQILAMLNDMSKQLEQIKSSRQKSMRFGKSLLAVALLAIVMTAVHQLYFKKDTDYYTHSEKFGPRRAVVIPPEKDNPSAQYGHAFSQYENGNLEMCLLTLGLFEDNIENQFDDGRHKYLRGMVYGAMGETPYAQRDLEYAIATYEAMGLWGNAGMAHLELGRTKIAYKRKQAAHHIKRGKELIDYANSTEKEPVIDAWYEISFDFELYSADYKKALQHAMNRLEHAKGDVLSQSYALSEISLAHTLRGELAQAQNAQKEIELLELESDYFDAYNGITQIFIRKSQGKPYDDLVHNVRNYLETYGHKALSHRLDMLLQLPQNSSYTR